MPYDSLHTMKRSYQDICEGEGPWVAIGNFMNDFFGYHPDRREDLLRDPLEFVEGEPAEQEQHQWAVFCAASVVYLSSKYHLPCPDWVNDPSYSPLTEPWYIGLGARRPAGQMILRQDTPTEFASKNIFCGDRVYANKHERAAEHRHQQLQAVKSA